MVVKIETFINNGLFLRSMPKGSGPRTTRTAMFLPIVPKNPQEREVYLTGNGASVMGSGPQSDVHKKPSDEKPSEDIPRDPCAFHTRKMPIVAQPLREILFEELRDKLRTEEGRLEATVLAVEKEITAKPIDVHRAIAHLEKRGFVDRAADIAFKMCNYPEAIAIYARAGLYAKAGSTAEAAQEYKEAAFFYLRAACAEDDINRGQRYLQRGKDLLDGKADHIYVPKDFLQPSMSSKMRKFVTRDTTQTACNSIGAEICGLFAEAANFAQNEGNHEMAGVYSRLSGLVEQLPIKKNP